MNPDLNPRRKRVYLFYGIAIALLILFNLLVTPRLGTLQGREVGYSDFLVALEQGTVRQIDLNADTTVAWTTPETESTGIYYYAARMEDDNQLTVRLDAYRTAHEGTEISFRKIVPRAASPLLTLLMYWILPIVFFAAIGQLLMRSMGKNLNGAMSFGKSNAKVYVQAQTGCTFDEVAGEDEAKAALQEIVGFLHDPQKYADIGAKLPKGALLVGPPGTGKTLLAKAVAGEAKVPFFSISGSEFVEMFVGMGAARVRDLFKQAQEKAPCIVFIDEIDAIGQKRQTGIGSNDEREQTLNQLLTEMDGFDPSKGVVILAATNRPENLDPALLRPGRLDRRIPVELPDLAGREAILRVHARHVKMADGIDYRALALATSGSSGAELANIINEGAIRAVKEGRKQVTQKDLEESVETVLAGYQRKNAVISPREKKVIAYHEIGHALVAARQSQSAPVHKITIIPRTSGALGYTMQVDTEERVLMTREEILNKITTLTAGRAAEELVFGQVTSGASNDIEQATRLARSMITRLGMSKNFDMTALATVNSMYLGSDTTLACSDETAAQIDREVVETIQECHGKAFAMLKADQEKLHLLAETLLTKETMTGDEFMALLNAA